DARVHEATALGDELRQSAAARVQQRYAAEGFDAATVAMHVRSRSPGEVDVVFDIDEGPALRLSAIALPGTLPLPEAEVRKAIDMAPGDRYTRERQRRAQTAVVRLLRKRHYYEVQVSSVWEPLEDHRGVLHVA